METPGEIPLRRLWKNEGMKHRFSASVWREGNWYVAQCLNLDIASQGETEEEALENLKEALELHFEPFPHRSESLGEARIS